jgi:HlyD family secretion protein
MNKRSSIGIPGIGRWAWIGAGSLAAVILVLFLVFRGNGNKPAFRTEPVTRGSIQQTVTATGTVNAVTTVLVGTQVSGTIRTLYVDFNSRVSKGQVIAQIDPATFESQVQQAQANLLVAQANQDKASASLTDTKRTFERNKELFAKNLIPRSDLETAETNFESARAQVSAARAQIEQAKASLDFAKQNLAYTKIISPVDGIVISRSVDVGQTVAASFQTPTLFTIAQDLTRMQIDTNVAESDIGVVKTGQDVEFTVDAFPDTTFKGRVWQIRKAPITVQNVVTYDVVVQVSNRDFKLMPGMTANVSIIITTREDVLRVPNAALRFRMGDRDGGQGQPGTAEKKGPAVWSLQNGRPNRLSLTTGISDGIYTEIADGELREGQMLIIESLKKNRGGAAPAGPRMF